MEEAQTSRPLAEEEMLNSLRQDIKGVAQKVKDFENGIHNREEKHVEEDFGEMIANAMLAYRCLEDASMRLGKVLQAKNGGVSVYDHNVVGAPEENE